MPLDPSIFMQYAQLKQRQNENLQNSFGGAVDDYTESKNKGFDLEKLAQQAVLKSEMGVQPSPDEQAAFNAYQKFEGAKQGMDPYTGQVYPKYKAFGLSGQSGGFDLGAIANKVPGFAGGMIDPSAIQSMPDSFIGGTNDVVGQAAAPAVPLDVSMLQPTGDPNMDAYRAKMFEMNQGMVGDALPEVAPKMSGFDLSTVAPTLGLTPEQKAMSPRKANEAEIDFATKQAEVPIEASKAAAVETAKKGAEITATSEAKKKSLDQAIPLIEEIEKTVGSTPSGYIDSMAAAATNLAGVPTPKAVAQGDIEPKYELLTTQMKNYIRGPGEGTWTDADQRKLDKLVPKPTDSVEVKKSKLKSLKAELLRAQGKKAPQDRGFKYLGTE